LKIATIEDLIKGSTHTSNEKQHLLIADNNRIAKNKYQKKYIKMRLPKGEI